MTRLPKVASGLLFFLTLLSVLPFAAQGQDYYAPSTPTLTPPQIDQMVAPIALYPDPLVAQILMAATYPLEVVEANRWLQESQNAQLQGDELASALAQQPWDPSVKSLIAFPQVLSMMDDNLQWSEQLGNAFIAQQASVMDSVQRLRRMAQASGALATTPQEIVTNDSGAIIITPADLQVVYVPYYNSSDAYGLWPYPDYPPANFLQPGVYYLNTAGPVSFSAGVTVINWLWGWDRWDWHYRRIDIDDRRFKEINRGRPPASPGVWKHEPEHRRGVPYAQPKERALYFNEGDQARQTYRGYPSQQFRNEVIPPVRTAQPPLQKTQTPPSDQKRTHNEEQRLHIVQQQPSQPTQPQPVIQGQPPQLTQPQPQPVIKDRPPQLTQPQPVIKERPPQLTEPQPVIKERPPQLTEPQPVIQQPRQERQVPNHDSVSHGDNIHEQSQHEDSGGSRTPGFRYTHGSEHPADDDAHDQHDQDTKMR